MPNQIMPRVIRLRDAPRYLGMDIHRFNKEVRPCVTTVRIGKQGIAFDRLDLDKWFEVYKEGHTCPITHPGGMLWEEKRLCLGSLKEKTSGTSIKSSVEDAFAKALARVNSSKQNDT